MSLFSVNQATDCGVERNGQCIEVEGLLNFEFEAIALNHWPKAEQRPDHFSSSIWLETEGVFSFNEKVMIRWHGKRVVVLGFLETSQPSRVEGWSNGFGHLGLWPTRLKARRIDLFKKRQKNQPEAPQALE